MKEKHISTTALSILTSSILCISCSQQMDAFTAIPDSVRTAEDGIAWALALNENAKDWNFKKSEYAYERLDGCFDFDRISEMAHLYEEAYRNWLEAREEIATYLPKEQGKSYREATIQMHARLYGDLRELKSIKY